MFLAKDNKVYTLIIINSIKIGSDLAILGTRYELVDSISTPNFFHALPFDDLAAVEEAAEQPAFGAQQTAPSRPAHRVKHRYTSYKSKFKKNSEIEGERERERERIFHI